LIQNEKESKLLLEGRRTGFWGGDGAGAGAEGVIVQQPSGGLGEEMVMPSAVQEGGVTSPVAGLPAISEGVDERLAGSEAEAVEDATPTHPHTDGTADSKPNTAEETLSNQTSPSPRMVSSLATTTIFENQTQHPARTKSNTMLRHFEIASAQNILSHTPRPPNRTRVYSYSDTTGRRTRRTRNSQRVAANHLDCFVPYMRYLE
jgi:hypothetical protein